MTQRNARADRAATEVAAPSANEAAPEVDGLSAPEPARKPGQEHDPGREQGGEQDRPQVRAVLEGLSLAGLTARKIARISGVSTETIQEWRFGRERAPQGRVVFLTLLLSHMVDELVRTYGQWGPAPKAWHLHMQGCLEKARDLLHRQAGENEGVSAGAFRQGERMFAEWLDQATARDEAAEAARRVAQGLDTTGLDL